MNIIDGKKLAKKIENKVAKEIHALNGARPNLAIILVGDRKDSHLYVSLKEKEAKLVGIDTHIYRMENNIPEEEILNTIDCLNKDELIDGILVQLPLPKQFDTDRIIAKIDPIKDVDRFHKKNLNDTEILSPVFSSVLEVLDSIKYDITGKNIGLVYNSDIFGNSLAKILRDKGGKVDLIKSSNPALSKKTKEADVLITAVGKPLFIKKEMVKQGAVIIDIGITKEEGRVLGDVDIEDVKGVVSYITPVPGGIGPMTIAMLFKNTLEIYKKRKG